MTPPRRLSPTIETAAWREKYRWKGPVERVQRPAVRPVFDTWVCRNPYCREWAMGGARSRVCHCGTPEGGTIATDSPPYRPRLCEGARLSNHTRS